MRSSARILPALVGRADLVRAGLDTETENRHIARWFGFEYRQQTADATSVPASSGKHRPTRAPVSRPNTAPTPERADKVIAATRITTRKDPDAAPQPPPQNLGAAAWGNRPTTPPKFHALTSGRRIGQLVERILNVASQRGRPDMVRIVRRIAQARPLIDLPRAQTVSRAETLQIVVDRSTRLTPLWKDQSLVVGQIRKLFPDTKLMIWVYEEASGALHPVKPDWPPEPDPKRGPLLVLGDLGLLAEPEQIAWWRALARQFVFDGGTASALVPVPVDQVPVALVGPYKIHAWEEEAAGNRAPDGVEQLMTLASAAVRLEPGLLRGIRLSAYPAASVADEVGVWQHGALASRSVEAASFDAGQRADYLRRLPGLLGTHHEAVKRTIAEVRNWRQRGADEIWYEELLGLPQIIREDPEMVDTNDLAAADAFFANMHASALENGLKTGQQAWLSRVGRRQRTRDGLWQHPHAAAALMSVLKNDPSFVPPVIVDTPKRKDGWHANVALESGNALTISDGTGMGQHLGTIFMHSEDVEIVTPGNDKLVSHAAVSRRGGTRIGGFPLPAVLKSAYSRMEINRLDPFHVPWAERIGRDAHGPYADCLGKAQLRFRWVPPGRGIVGPLGGEPQGNTTGRREEAIFATGFWLAERPITMADIATVLGLSHLEYLSNRSRETGYLRDAIERQALNRPLTSVTLPQVVELFDAFREQNNHTRFRLPSTLEWEYACRAGVFDQTTYLGTPDVSDTQDHILSNAAWFRPTEEMLRAEDRLLRVLNGPQPPMQKTPNAWGFYDMLGNVAEMCSPENPMATRIETKGGFYNDPPASIRFAHRDTVDVDQPANWVGIRPAIGRPELEALRRVDTPPTPPRPMIKRNRPPRVQIEYELEQRGTITSVELPFVMGVMADLSGDSETPEALKPISERSFIETDHTRLDALMEHLVPRVATRVANRIPAKAPGDESEELAIDLRFKQMSDFAPDQIARQIPALDALLTARTGLAQLLSYMEGKVDAEKRVHNLLEDPVLLARFAEKASKDPGDAVNDAESAPREAVPPNSPEAQEVDAFSDLLQKDFRIAKSDEPKLTSLISNLAVAVLDNLNEYFPGTAAETITSLIARIDRILSDQMNEVLHCEKLRRVEGTWRGLHFLVFNTETDQKLKIRVLNIKKSELSKTLQDYDGSMWDRSPVFDLIYTREYATLGGVPFGAIIGAYEFSHAPDDVALLRNMSGIAATAHAPFIAAASPRLFGFDGWIELPNPRDLKLIQSSPDYAAWQSLRESEDSRYIGLTMPRMLARPTYGAATFLVDGFDFEETTHALPDNYIWMNAAFAMGVNINRSYKQYGWGARIRGFESGGAVTDLPVDTSPIDNTPHSMVGPTEVSIDDRREAELSKLGLIPLLHRKNTSSAAFIGVGSLQDSDARAARLADPDAQSNERLSANLPHLLAVSRFAQYLKVIARDKIGAFSERSDLQSHLNEWISQYVLNDPTVADDKQRAKRPLASAEIQIDRSETRPGFYTARFFLRPYYQLEGTTVSLRLVSELLAGER